MSPAPDSINQEVNSEATTDDELRLQGPSFILSLLLVTTKLVMAAHSAHMAEWSTGCHRLPPDRYNRILRIAAYTEEVACRHTAHKILTLENTGRTPPDKANRRLLWAYCYRCWLLLTEGTSNVPSSTPPRARHSHRYVFINVETNPPNQSPAHQERA